MSKTRAEMAESGHELASFALWGGPDHEMDPGDYQAGITDALVNLMHFAEREDMSFDRAADSARMHYEREKTFDWEEVPEV